MALLTVMKGLPLTYNRDLQEDKEGFFDTVDTLLATLEVFQGMLAGLTLNQDQLTRLAGESYMLATDLADYLVGKGVPFREAHGIMRQLCEYCEAEERELSALSLEDYRRFSAEFDAGVYKITALASVAARDNPGGTAPNRVSDELNRARQLLEAEGDDI
jgi:argininosuccinate lyase